MIKVVHLITDLSTGGAEVMLAKLIMGMDQTRFTNCVISLTDHGQLEHVIRAAGAAIHCLGMQRGQPTFAALPKLARIIKVNRPTLIQTWLYHADLLGLVAARFAGSPPVVWNVRCSNMELQYYSHLTRLVRRMLALSSRFPAAVVVNSHAGQALHHRMGYRPRRWEVIPNGFDLQRFQPSQSARRWLRAELGLPEDTVLVAFVARVDPMKDHETFLTAASQITAVRPAVHFVLVGKDTQNLFPRVRDLGLHNHLHLLGQRSDVDRLIPGADVGCLSSAFGEGCPNVLGEAMAAGVPCVATDVGDACALIGDTGKVVPPRDPKALAAAVIELIDQGPAGRAALGQAARSRIQADYSLPSVVEHYQRLYEELARRAA